MARQPIFDTAQAVHAYELLFRSGPENFFAHGDADDASRKVISNTFHNFGLEALASRKKLFINCTRRVLLEGVVGLFPATTAVVEVLETVEPDGEVLRALQTLKAKGYPVALDDFVFRPGHEALVALADVIKVDFRATKGDERAAVVKRFARPGLRFLAEKVETQMELGDAVRAGYSLFQGYFFARPQMIEARDVPASKLAKLRLVKALVGDVLDFDELERILKSDLALSVKLLRYLNSASFGWRSQIDSIKHALVLLGDKALRQWATLVLMTMLADDKADELVTSSLVRARLCEQIALRTGRREKAFDLFLVGLLSTLDAILRRPLPEVLDMVAVARPVRSALLEGTGELAGIFLAVRAYERGEWDDPALAQLEQVESELPRLYLEAVKWAQVVSP